MPTPTDIGDADLSTYSVDFRDGALVTVTRQHDDGTIAVGLGRSAGPDAENVAYRAALADLNRDPDEPEPVEDARPARFAEEV